MSNRNKRNRPAIPGEPCPAERNNAHNDPKVTIDHSRTTSRHRFGTRTCGRCGREGVPVEQSHGDAWTAWYYAPHTVPTPEQTGENR